MGKTLKQRFAHSGRKGSGNLHTVSRVGNSERSECQKPRVSGENAKRSGAVGETLNERCASAPQKLQGRIDTFIVAALETDVRNLHLRVGGLERKAGFAT